MSYEAVIAPITNLRPIEKADRLVAGTVAGYQVVTSKDTVEGTVGVFFQEGGQVSLEYARANNLHRHGDLNEDKSKTGLFDDNRRIRAQRLRGAISEGFWAGLSTLEFTGVDVSKLKVGFTFDELNKIPICNKYYTKATRQAMAGGGKTSKKGFKPSSIPDFKEHYDTKQLRLMIGNIPSGAVISITEKVHGCVSEDTVVETLEHGSITIKEIVDNKKKIHIKSMDVLTGEVVFQKVEDWYLLKDDGEWYEITLENGIVLKITGNNPVWLPSLMCYRTVENLSVGDELFVD